MKAYLGFIPATLLAAVPGAAAHGTGGARALFSEQRLVIKSSLWEI